MLQVTQRRSHDADCVSSSSFMCHNILNGMAQYKLVHKQQWKELLEKWVIKFVQKRHLLRIWPTSYMKEKWSRSCFCYIHHFILLQLVCQILLAVCVLHTMKLKSQKRSGRTAKNYNLI